MQQFSFCGVGLWPAGCGAFGSAGSRKLRTRADQRFSTSLLKMRIAACFVSLLGAIAFSVFSLIIACVVKSRERFMGIGQLLTMPLFFASNAIYPISIMPGWLKVIAHINPLTYQVDALRALMIQGGESVFGLGLDFAVLGATVTLLVTLCARIYPNLVR